MSNEHSKFVNSKRRHCDEKAIKRQLRIIRSHGSFGSISRGKDEHDPHRLAKKHAMDCGNPKCYLCGNPRKTHKDRLTQQEKRIYQDLDKTNNRHSNGSPQDE